MPIISESERALFGGNLELAHAACATIRATVAKAEAAQAHHAELARTGLEKWTAQAHRAAQHAIRYDGDALALFERHTPLQHVPDIAYHRAVAEAFGRVADEQRAEVVKTEKAAAEILERGKADVAGLINLVISKHRDVLAQYRGEIDEAIAQVTVTAANYRQVAARLMRLSTMTSERVMDDAKAAARMNTRYSGFVGV